MMQQNHNTSITLIEFSGEPRIDSRAIADQLGVENKNTRELIEKYLPDFEEFGVCPFETAKPPQGSYGGRPEKFALLNEDQSYLLLTYAQNTEQARALKIRLVRSFGEYRRGKLQSALASPLSAALLSSINRHAWRLAQSNFDDYQAAMLGEARSTPGFQPEHWTPMRVQHDAAQQLAINSRYRQRDCAVLQLRMAGMSYREIGANMGISKTHAWRIATRQIGNNLR